MFAASLQIAARGYSQGISISLKNEPLEKLFNAVEQQTNFRFVYSQEAMEQAKPVTIEVKNESVENVLKLGFTNQTLTYSIEEKFIIIKIAEKKKEVAALRLDIKGRVVNENGEGVIVTITEKGTTNAVSTDGDGYFQLKDADENAILIVTGVGIESMEIKIAGKSNVSISVKTKITGLTEVIINKGYYSTSQRLNTGNVSKVTAETISKQPVSNPLAALEGRVPGLYIQQTSGVPGSAFVVQIRGRNSIRIDGNDPLFIVDGVPFTSTSISSALISSGINGSGNPLGNIDPSDIESIEVLKDADATSIYGSRGANGVVLITTKKGSSGKTKVDFNVYTGAGKAINTIHLLTTQQYLSMRREAFANDGVTPTISNAKDLFVWDTTRYTDWKKLLIGGSANITDAHSSISGGNLNTQFVIGGGYHRETTVFPSDFEDQKVSGHFKLSHSNSNNRFKANFSLIYVVDNNTLPSIDITNQIYGLVPDAPEIYDSSGNLNWGPSNGTYRNPFGILKRKYFSNTNNLISNAILAYQVFSRLQLKVNLGYNSMQMNETQTTPKISFDPRTGPQSEAYFGDGEIKSWIIEPQAEYKKDIARGKLNALVGTTFQQDIRQGKTVYGTGFVSDALLENIAAASTILVFNPYYIRYRYESVFGRLNYNWTEKYIINLTGRRDGSSRFGPEKRFANFASIGTAWLFSNERFVQRSLPFLSYGKFRASYGSSGNDQIPDYGYLNLYSTTLPYLSSVGLYPTSLFNAEYGWETNKKIEAALELGFLKDRILFSVSYYRNRSSNQLVGYPLPYTTGFNSIQKNLPALVQNTGIELEINTINIRHGKFLWTTSFNLTVPRNKLIDYPGLAVSSFANRFVVGKSLFIQKKFHYTGIDSQSGIYQFEDFDKNGNPIPTLPNDLQALKEATQDYYGGLQNSIQYKGLQLDMFFQFVKQQGFNYLNSVSFIPGALGNQPDWVMERWQKPGDITNIQKFTQYSGSPAAVAYNNARFDADNLISDASFIRLKNLAISCQLPPKWVKKARLQNSRVFLQGQNLLTITNYRGSDPENQNSVVLPPLRIITAGIQITL